MCNANNETFQKCAATTIRPDSSEIEAHDLMPKTKVNTSLKSEGIRTVDECDIAEHVFGGEGAYLTSGNQQYSTEKHSNEDNPDSNMIDMKAHRNGVAYIHSGCPANIQNSDSEIADGNTVNFEVNTERVILNLCRNYPESDLLERKCYDFWSPIEEADLNSDDGATNLKDGMPN